jgi:protein-L-isoaspartate O-methyltransferase
MSEWKSYAVRLADQLRAQGDLRTPAWHAAIAETPRHVLVPTVYQPPEGVYSSCTGVQFNTAEHLELIYSTTTLVTAVVPNTCGSLGGISSSTKPDLMVRMLEALDIREGQRILEIGTGTGYNAALLAHRLGDDHVFSVDVDPELLTTARQRLARLGRRPQLAVRDGAEGWPQHAPYDRITPPVPCARFPGHGMTNLCRVGGCWSTSNPKAAIWCCWNEKPTGSKAGLPRATPHLWSCASRRIHLPRGSLNSR